MRRGFFVYPLIVISLLSVLALLPQPVNASQIVQFQVGASSDDCTKYTTNQFSLIRTSVSVGLSTVTYQDNGLRFNNISLDSSFTLYYAKLKFTASATQIAGPSTRIYGEDQANPSTFTNLTDFNLRLRTSTYVTWAPTSWTVNNQYEVDITNLFLTLLNNASWVSGNSMVFFWTLQTSTIYKNAYSYDGSSSKAVILEVKYKETFYATFYTNNSYAKFYDTVNQMQLYNETQFPMLEGSAIQLWASMNSSYYFQNYTVIGDATYLDNPLLWTMPENFGNTTIWAYSQLTNPPPSSIHGEVSNSSNTWDNSWNATTGTVLTNSTELWVGYQYSGVFFTHTIYRIFFNFDTSYVGSNTVTSAVLRFYVNQSSNFNVNVQYNSSGVYPHIPLAAGDYDKSNYDFPIIGEHSVASTGIIEIPIDIVAINKTGYTKLVLRADFDVQNNHDFLGSKYAIINDLEGDFQPELIILMEQEIGAIPTEQYFLLGGAGTFLLAFPLYIRTKRKRVHD